MRGPWKPLLLTLIVIAVLLALLLWPARRVTAPIVSPQQAGVRQGPAPLLLYCAAGVKNPVVEIAEAYEKEFGVPVQLDYGGSGTLLSKLEVARRGDLYLAGDASYIDIAREKGLVAERIPVARMHPVIAVQKGNPKNIQSVRDLMREDVRLSLGAPEAASIGKQGQRLLESLGLWEQISETARARGVFKPTVNDIANDVKLGAMDAGIVWDATVKQYPELEAVAIEGADAFVEYVTVGVVTFTKQPTAALRFARYLTARDKGQPIFSRNGYAEVQGADAWAETPEILYFSGGVNRVAIEETLERFEEREGCEIKTVYNGCGILVGQMKLGERPDAYHSCDQSFMRDVGEMFTPAVKISQTPMVIVTAKGNPFGIHALADLGREGLRIGLANEQQSALGELSARLLKKEGLYDAVTKNVVANTPTADLLVNQISTGALDVVIVYEANMTYQKDKLDMVPIPLAEAMAVQTYAAGKDSSHQQLVGRLLEALESPESREKYRQCGFREVTP